MLRYSNGKRTRAATPHKAVDGPEHELPSTTATFNQVPAAPAVPEWSSSSNEVSFSSLRFAHKHLKLVFLESGFISVSAYIVFTLLLC